MFLPHLPAKVLAGAAASNNFLSPEQLDRRGQLNPHGFSRGWGHAPMKQREARELIVQEWDRWIRSHPIDRGGPTGKDSLKFFIELQDAGSPLLDFPSRGQDKWRIIHAWLLSAERVFDYWISPAPPIVPARKPRSARHKAKT